MPQAALGPSSAPTAAAYPGPAIVPGNQPVRALVVGSGIGAVLAAGNVYAGLKTGYIDGGSVPAALLGSLLLGLWGRRPASAQDLNLTQTVASSAAVMSFAAGVGAPIPAMALAGHAVPSAALCAWAICVGGLGVGWAWLLRPRLILAERLPFPSGQATAEVILAIAADGAKAEAGQPRPSAGWGRLHSLALAAAIAAAWVLLRDRWQLVPANLTPGIAVFGLAAGALTLGLAASPLLLATGILVGPRAGVSMGLGALLAWAGLAPQLLSAGAAAEASYSALVPVLLWPGLALMTVSALTKLVLAHQSWWRGFGDLYALATKSRPGRAPGAARPSRWGWWLLGAGGLGATVIIAVTAFGLSPLMATLALPVAFLLSAAAARAAGETDQAPVGQMGAVAQLGMAGRGVIPSLAAGALVSGVATQTAQTSWAFKAGHRLGASPRIQVLAQLIGVAVGAVVVVPIYGLLARVHRLGSEAMPAPAALAWKATSEAAQGALALTHPLVWKVTLAAAVLAVLLALLERRFSGLPSPTAMGAAFVLPASMSLTILAAAILFGAIARRRPGFAATHGAPLAAGGIAGEALMGLLLAAMAVGVG